jgi:hypothetical protein
MRRLTVVSIDPKKKKFLEKLTCIIKISWFIFGVFIWYSIGLFNIVCINFFFFFFVLFATEILVLL